MRSLTPLLLGLALAGCIVVPVEVDQWAEAPRAPQPGDLVRVHTRKGAAHVFRVYKTDETAFYGVAKNNRKYRVPYGALTAMEVRVRETEWVPVTPSGAGHFLFH